MYRRRSVRRVYRRRPRFSFKRSSRRRNVSRRTGTWAKTNGGTVASFPYKGRRVSRAVYKRRLRVASDVSEHYRSALTRTGILATAGLIGQALVGSTAFIPNNFWTPSAGLQNYTIDREFSGDLFIRGGRSSITFSNPNAGAVRIRLWKVRTKANGNVGSSLPLTAVSTAWDPTLVEDFQKFYNVREPSEFILRSAQCMMHVAPIRSEKIDQDIFIAEGQRDYWVYTYTQVDVAVAQNIVLETTNNLSVTGDATVN